VIRLLSGDSAYVRASPDLGVRRRREDAAGRGPGEPPPPEILERLDDPGGSRVSGGDKYPDASGGVLDDGQDVLALAVEGDGLDEIATQQGANL
jgi:hypothetical protein